MGRDEDVTTSPPRPLPGDTVPGDCVCGVLSLSLAPFKGSLARGWAAALDSRGAPWIAGGQSRSAPAMAYVLHPKPHHFTNRKTEVPPEVTASQERLRQCQRERFSVLGNVLGALHNSRVSQAQPLPPFYR